MKEAIKKGIDFGFDVVQLTTLVACVQPGNERSSGLLEKNNFYRDYEAETKNSENEEMKDMMIYTLHASQRLASGN